jgi:uncharacterized phiE125 gp8 family phage protein
MASVEIQYVAGYGDDAEDVPFEIAEAIQMILDHYYQYRGMVITGTIVTEVPYNAIQLLDKHNASEFR